MLIDITTHQLHLEVGDEADQSQLPQENENAEHRHHHDEWQDVHEMMESIADSFRNASSVTRVAHNIGRGSHHPCDDRQNDDGILDEEKHKTVLVLEQQVPCDEKYGVWDGDGNELHDAAQIFNPYLFESQVFVFTIPRLMERTGEFHHREGHGHDEHHGHDDGHIHDRR